MCTYNVKCGDAQVELGVDISAQESRLSVFFFPIRTFLLFIGLNPGYPVTCIDVSRIMKPFGHKY